MQWKEEAKTELYKKNVHTAYYRWLDLPNVHKTTEHDMISACHLTEWHPWFFTHWAETKINCVHFSSGKMRQSRKAMLYVMHCHWFEYRLAERKQTSFTARAACLTPHQIKEFSLQQSGPCPPSVMETQS